MFNVYDNDRPAILKEACWSNNSFKTFEEALEYARSWLDMPDVNLEVDEPFDYSVYGDIIEIREE